MSNYSPLLTGVGFSGYRSIASWQEFRFPTNGINQVN
jgi:hypothetical protein